MKPLQATTLHFTYLNQLYKSAQSSYVKEMASRGYLNGPLWKQEGETLLLLDNKLWTPRHYIPSLHDQEHEYRGEDMLKKAWQYNCESILRNALKNDQETSPHIGWISRKPSGANNLVEELMFKRGDLGSFKLNTLTEKETFHLLKNEAAEKVMEYEEKRLNLMVTHDRKQ